MALVPLEQITVKTPAGTATAIVIYQNTNRRIQSVEWNIPFSGYAIRVVVIDTNIDPNNPIYDQTYGQGSGSENIPGNYQAVFDPELGADVLPPNLLVNYYTQGVGPGVSSVNEAINRPFGGGNK